MPASLIESGQVGEKSTLANRYTILRGRAQILRMQKTLRQLSTLCGQHGAMDFLEYFLTLPENRKKTPYLILATSGPHDDVSQLQAEDLLGAVLIYEYTLFGLPSKLFNTSDFNGLRAVVAPVSKRAALAASVCRMLVEQGARVALLSLSGVSKAEQLSAIADGASGRSLLWTTQDREVGGSLILEATLDATLAHLGNHTRRNLRYYRRKAETEFGCTFANDVRDTLTRQEFTELNRHSKHPVPNTVLERRYATLKTLEGSFCVGLRSSSGQWISLMAGRRHHDVTEIDWQMNRGGLAKYSIGTVIRAYLIEHEVILGRKRLAFEGGTPHTLRHSFLSETAVDVVVTRKSSIIWLLRRGTALLHLRNNFLLQVLVNPALKWERH